jgi:hypothetical protein
MHCEPDWTPATKKRPGFLAPERGPEYMHFSRKTPAIIQARDTTMVVAEYPVSDQISG